MATLVIGGTGQVGSLVVQGLLAKGEPVRVMTRSKEKAGSAASGAEFVVGDLNEPKQARPAFDGVDAVFMLNPVSPTEANEGLMAAALIHEAGIRRVVYMGVHQSERAAYLPHFGSKVGVEAGLRASGAAWTFLRPSNFFQNDLWLREPVMQHGVYPQPIGNVGLNRVDTRDIADAAVNAITGSGFEERAYSLVGPRALTGEECATILGRAVGRSLTYNGDLDGWEQAMTGMLPAGVLFDFTIMFAHFQRHGLLATDEEVRDCEAIVGHPLRSYEAFAKELKAMW